MLFIDKYPFDKIRTFCKILAYDRCNNLIWTLPVGANKIVTTGRQLLSRLLGGLPGGATTMQTATRTVNIGGVADLYVEYMQFGSGGHNPVTSAALGVSPSDESLNVPLTSIPAKPVTVSYPGTPPGDKAIEFTAGIDYAEANGDTLSEFGLFTRSIISSPSDALMFAKKNHAPPIVKDASFRLEYKHRIIF